MLLSRSEKPLFYPDKPWEIGGNLNITTVLPDPDGKRLRMYYMVSTPKNPLKNVLCLAYSDDGVNWEKPSLFNGTNIVFRSSGFTTHWGVFSSSGIIYDENERNPQHRWKMIYWDRPERHTVAGICLAISPDGLCWQALKKEPLITNYNDAASFINANQNIDTLIGGNYFIYQQVWKYNPALPMERDNLKGMQREIAIWTAGKIDDHWRGPMIILEPDAEDPTDTQFYHMVPFHYQHGYRAFLFIHHTIDQTMDVQLVRSADGFVWERELNRQPILPLGEKGRFDCGMSMASGAPILWQDKVLVYYNGRATVHDGQLRYPDAPAPDPIRGIAVATYSLDLVK
ncbi:hypothetical protein KAH55_07705 [bacterium]|nr:hypothetical protein [bacterium]